MKKLSIYLLIGGLYLSSCETKTTTTNSEVTTNEEHSKNMDMVYRAIESGNTSALDSIIDPDIIDHGTGRDIRGRDSLKYMLSDIRNHFTNLKFENISTASNGDYVFTLVRMTGTASDNVMGFPQGSAVNSTSIDLVKLNADGKAIEHWAFMDPNEMMKMMGAMPQVMPSVKTDTTKIDSVR